MNTQESIQTIRNLRPGWPGRLLHRLLPLRRKVVEENIDIVFGDSLTADEKKRLAQGFYEHILKIVAEGLAMSFMSDEAVRRQSRVVGREILLEAARGGKGILFLTGHIGNFELCPVAAILNFPEYKGRFHFVRRNIGNKFIEKLLFSRFYRVGLGVIPKRGSVNTILDALARNDAITFIMDQYARPGREGIEVEFFGRKAGTFKSLAILARASGAPVLPAICHRGPDGRHVMEFREPLPWVADPDPDREIYLNTLGYNRVLESIVLEFPDQWWWFHRRWKTK